MVDADEELRELLTEMRSYRRGQRDDPRYCAEHYEEAQRALNALRVKAYHRRKAGPRTGFEKPPGRPRK